MKTKTQLTNRILSLVLTLVMVFGMLPMSSLTAFAAASKPACSTNEISGSYGEVWANGTPLYITQGTGSGLTAIYYYEGSNKVYLNPNGASGFDCSQWCIYGGSKKNTRLISNTSITMDGGSIEQIYGGSSYAPLEGDVEINLTGGSVKKVIGSCQNEGMIGNISINLNGATVQNVFGVSGRVEGDLSIRMTSGTVDLICALNDENLYGDCNVTITGGTVGRVYGMQAEGYKIDGNATFLITDGATVTVEVMPEAPNRVITGSLSGFIAAGGLNSQTTDKTAYFSDLVYKDGSTWVIKGGAKVPTGVTLNLVAGESLLVGSGQSLTNNGTIVNNGTMTIDGSFVNKGSIQNNGTIIINGSYQNQGTVGGSGEIIRNAAYIATNQSTAPTVYANGNQVSVIVEQVNGKLYLYGATGNIKATLNGKNYYGNRSGNVAVELKEGYTAPSSITSAESTLYANKTYNINELFVAGETTLPLKWEYSLTNTENAKMEFSDNKLIAYEDCTLKIKVSVDDTYNTFSKEFTFNVKTVPVTRLSFEIPSVIYLGQTITLPKVLPENASYQNIEWSLEGNCASLNNGSLKALAIGECVLKGTVKNGLAYGQDYTISKKISVKLLDYIDVSVGSVTVEKKDDNTLIVTYAPFGTQYSNEEGKREYAAEDTIAIRGGYPTDTNNTITVKSGSPKIIIQDVCISNNSSSPFTIADGASVQLQIEGSNKLQGGDWCAGLAIGYDSKVTIDGSGELECSSGQHAGISCGDNREITINGGTVTASSSGGAGIGGNGGGNSAGTITINGGNVTASSVSGAGIGGGYKGLASAGGSGGTITINGGNVTARSEGGAGIGGGSKGLGGTITINGGTVQATSSSKWAGAGIGGGYEGGAGTIIINGGTITATSNGNYAGAGVGTGGKPTAKEDNGVVIIRGGNINATSIGNGGKFSGCVVHNGTENGENGVQKYTITLNGITQQVTVDRVEGIPSYYGLKDVKSIDGKLYLWFPTGQTITGVIAGEEEFIGTINGTSGSLDLVVHKHEWTYTISDDDTITATCKNSDGNCSDTNGGSVTLKVSNAYYTDSAIGATVEGSFTNDATYKVTYNDGAETAPSNIGTHTAKLTVSENGTEKQSVTAEYKISYLPAANPAYAISGGYQNGDAYWFKTGTSVTVNAPADYEISTTLNGTYEKSVSFSEYESKTVYLKRVSDGALTDAINVEGIYFDGNGATGKITIESRGFWEKLLNKITFGLFFKGDAVAKISAMDDESGVQSVQYYLTDEDLIDDDTLDNAAAVSKLGNAIGNNWKNYSDEIALNKNSKNIIYVKITDNVGNVTYISSEGIVLYSDAEAVTESVSATYKAGENKDITVKLNGNTVKSVANGTTALTEGTDYTVSDDGIITLKADYLDMLNAGTYTFTVSYNPLGETYVEATGNDAPATTTFKVVIEKADGEVSNINISGKTYDGTAVTDPTFDKLGDGTATIEYKVKGTDDSTYTTTAPSAAEDYIVRVTIAEGTNYKAASSTAEFTISRATLKDVSVQQNGKLTYDGGKALTPAVTANATALNGAKVLFKYSADGEKFGSMPTFTKAGTYTVYYQAYTTDNNFIDQYGTFTVTIDKAIVTEPTIVSKPYNSSAQKADISDTNLYTVVKNEGGTAKGSYDVVLKLKDADNYKWSTTDNAEVTVQFVISAAQNTWETKPAISGWTYGETANAPTYKAKFGTVKVVYSGKANDGTDYNSETAPTKAGSYTATFTVEGTEDYSGLSQQVNFTIAKKAVTVTANDATKAYGDSDPALTYTNTALVGSDALVITVTRASGENANTYTITASQAEGANPNYEITFKAGTFTIRKAPLTVTAEDKSAAYGDAIPTYTVKYEGFKNGDNKDDLGGTLNFYWDYRQYDDAGEYEIMPYGLTSDNYVISYNFGKLTVSPKPITVTIQNATSIYGETLAELKATDNGIVNNDKDVYSLATVATSTSNVGKYAITGTALDSNYAITFVNGEYEITKREITITVEAKNTIVNTALPTYTYKVEGLVDEDKLVTVPTLTSNADITVIGEYDITATGADAGGNYSIKYVPAKLTVLTDNAVDAAAGYTEELKDYDPATVTSEDKAELDKILNEINTILDDENITDNGKKALEDVKEQVEKLIKEITDAADATDTENVGRVENVTPENVTPENKTDLEGAKADLAELKKPADPNAPATGDNSNMFLWIALLFISGGAFITLTVVDRKRRTAKR